MKKIISIILALVTAISLFIGISIAANLAGDTNGDGETDNKDVVLLFRFVSGNTAKAIAENCDFNGDGEIDNKDVVALFRAVTVGGVTTSQEVTTEEVTEEVPPREELTYINFREESDSVLSFFTKASYCEAEFIADGSGENAVSVKTKNILSAASKPAVFFLYSDYCESQDMTPADFTERPFVVLRVKAIDTNDRMFTMTGTESDKSFKSTNEASVRIPGGDGWHYICLDFTQAKTPEKFNAFRIALEQTAGGDGEAVLISEMRVCTAEEAAEFAEHDVYPVQEQTMDDYKLKVLQFNVQTENGNGAPFAERSEMYRKLIEELQPDVVGMQEVTVTWRKWLDSYVFNESYAGVGEVRSKNANDGLEANPIYYRKDKFDLLEYGTFWLSSTPDVVGSKIETEVEVDGQTVKYTANYPRICTWVRLKDKSTGMEFVHLNTHLDHNGSNSSTGGNPIRKKEIGVIIKFAQRFKDLPMFLTGDLNNKRTTSEGKTYALIKMIQGDSKFTDDDGTKYSIALSDTRLKAPDADTVNIATMTKYYDESNSAYNPSNEPIDYIFFDDEAMNALSYKTFMISKNGAWISDHLPVFATFIVTPPQE